MEKNKNEIIVQIAALLSQLVDEIGRASCRERV